MSAEKFVARLGYPNDIRVVTIDKETEASVWVGGNRRAKITEYENYFDTWQEAKDCIVANARSELRRAKMRVDRARSKLQSAEKLKPIE